ncbi:MAG: ABC transporter substrate-binding protein [Sulfurospirillaceae bacterium]|nr:ABC transporter substrate-binding protein [Sulfurospirillaceae bacterium]
MRYFWIVCLTALLLAQHASALEESAIEPFMKKNVEVVASIIRDKALKEDIKATKIFGIFDQVFDYTTMSKISLGSVKWKELNKSQQDEFSRAFEQKLKNSYMSKLNLYTDEKIVLGGMQKINNTRIQLLMTLFKNNEKYEVIYKFYKTNNNEWLIYDVDVLGVSIIQTYKIQFAEFLQKEPFEKLLEKLKNKES